MKRRVFLFVMPIFILAWFFVWGSKHLLWFFIFNLAGGLIGWLIKLAIKKLKK